MSLKLKLEKSGIQVLSIGAIKLFNFLNSLFNLRNLNLSFNKFLLKSINLKKSSHRSIHLQKNQVKKIKYFTNRQD